MKISNTTLIVLLLSTIFITYIVCKFTMNCDINCYINYNKTEDYINTNSIKDDEKKPLRPIITKKKKMQLKIHL